MNLLTHVPIIGLCMTKNKLNNKNTPVLISQTLIQDYHNSSNLPKNWFVLISKLLEPTPLYDETAIM